METPSPLSPVDPNTPSRYMQNKIQGQILEKPLPPPPNAFDRVRAETPQTGSPAPAQESPSHGARPSLTAIPSFMRPRKRFIVGGKGCVIALPLENDQGRKTTLESYLKPEDVQQRLNGWESKGFDTKGFVLASPSTEPAASAKDGQSRSIHPDSADELRERSKESFRVSIPDRCEWEAYVNNLKEEKLRALGVSSGDDEPQSRKSPAPSLMSRGASSQGSSMLLSPPLAPTSVGSLQFPPQFQGPTQMSALPGKQAVSHFPRYSVVAPFDGKPIQLPNQFPQARSPGNGAWSPQPFLSSQPNSRIGSPLANGHAQNIGGFSPASPMLKSSMQVGPPKDPNDLLAQMRRQESALQVHQMQQQQQQQNMVQTRLQPADAKLRPVEMDHPLAHGISRTPILTPTPRGALHRQNPSESLQREVEEAEAALEASAKEEEKLREQLVEDKAAELKEQINKTVKEMPAEVNANDKEQKSVTKVAEVPDEKQPIKDSTKEIEVEDEPKSGEDSKITRERSKSSVSKLNVNAPEFKFEPKEGVSSGVFSFLGDSQPTHVFGGTGPMAPAGRGHAKKPSVGAMSKLNVAAPVFKPQSAPKPLIPSGEFSFSSQGPLFNPDAPAFTPSDPVSKLRKPTNATGTSVEEKENPIVAVKKIFGDVQFSDVLKPAKKSKALPILAPKMNRNEENAKDDLQEDESGRLVRTDSRQKRARRTEDDGDQVPMFASPKGTPWLGDGQEDRAAYFGNSGSSSASEDDKPVSLGTAAEVLKDVLDEIPSSVIKGILHETKALELSEIQDESYTFHDVDQAANFSTALPPQVVLEKKQGKDDPSPEDMAKSTIDFPSRSSQYNPEFDDSLERRISDISSISSPLPISEKRESRQPIDEDNVNRIDHAQDSKPLRQDILDGVRYIEPSYDELDTVMKHLNEDSDVGIVRRPSPWNRPSSAQSPLLDFYQSAPQHQLLPSTQIRSDAPSPSPNRLKGTFQYLPVEPTDSESVDSTAQKARELVARNARFSPSFRPSKGSPQLNRLASPGSSPPSEWNDVVSSGDEDKFHARTAFFDHRVNEVVGGIVQQRLDPLEKHLAAINSQLELISDRSTSRRPRSSGATVEVVNSDADDEDDDTQPLERSSSRLKSPIRDRKFDQLKSTVSEIATAQKGLVHASQLADLMEAVKDLKTSVTQVSAPERQIPAGDVKSIIEEVLGKQLRGRSEPVTSSSHAAVAERHALQLAGLESMLKVAETRADDELKARRSTEDALADNQRLLRSALQEAAQQRESAEETERSLQHYHTEQHHLLKRMASLEGSQEQLEKMASDLTEKNVALEGTLAEYRLSSDKWRTDIEDARHENKDLKRQVHSSKTEAEHLIQDRSALRARFDAIQDQFHAAGREAAEEQARSHGKDEEHRIRLDMLSARLEAEARTRERLETEIERLESQEKESMRARFQADQLQKANEHLDHLVGKLQSEGHEQQNNASRLQRDLHIANETKTMEVHRIRSLMTADVEAAKAQANNVRADLQNVVTRLEKQLAEMAADAENFKHRHELMLEEASESRHAALGEAAAARENALQGHYKFHERTLQDVKSQHERAIGEVDSQHKRTLDHAIEDKAKTETHWANRLSLADEKEKNLRDRVEHLEEKLEIAKSAAHAAVQAAKASKALPASNAAVIAITDGTSSSRRDLSSIPEKISPQALRESILVLQEQLQAREGRIEDLEIQLSKVDRDAPSKLKDADVEITWLRELLGVRIDDLEDIIKTLSQPSYDREAVKDAATRLKANLQMEQQEKERALAGGTPQSFPSLSSLAASPRAALPLAAAAAWGNWRKGRDSAFGSLSGIANGGTSAQQTPSKSSTPQSLFAGLMTPPSTDIRTTPPYQAGSRPTSSSAQGKRPFPRPGGAPSTPRQSFGETTRPLTENAPVTPPLNLMRKSSYDLDAREGPGFDTAPRDDSGEVDGFNTGIYDEVTEEEEPFGPRIGTFGN